MGKEIAEVTFQKRKDKCLDEVEEACNIDHDIVAYKKKVADFIFPNANTSRRNKKILEDAKKSASKSDQSKSASEELLPYQSLQLSSQAKRRLHFQNHSGQ